jgi:large subunit ribosomal protein L25
MARPELAAQPRAVHGKAVKHLRQQGLVPAVVYGHGFESQDVQLDAHEFALLRRKAGRNTLLDLKLDGGRPTPVLVHGVQEHPISRAPLHVDLLVVKMTEELTVDVQIVFTGESVAVERMGGVMLHLRESLQVKALPDHLPQSVELDITPLDNFDQVLHVSDIVMPSDVTLLTDPSEPVARVQAPRIEEEPVVEEAEEGAAAEGAEEGAETAAEGETESEYSAARRARPASRDSPCARPDIARW